MPKLKLAIVLPITMLCVAFPVARWQDHVESRIPAKREYPFVSTATLAYQGINAPALVLKQVCATVLPNHIDEPPLLIFGVGVRQLLFFGALIIVWYVVGHFADRGRQSPIRMPTKITPARVVLALCIALYALVLLAGAFYRIGHFRYSDNPTGSVVEGSLFLAWSIALLLCSAATLRHRSARTG